MCRGRGAYSCKFRLSTHFCNVSIIELQCRRWSFCDRRDRVLCSSIHKRENVPLRAPCNAKSYLIVSLCQEFGAFSLGIVIAPLPFNPGVESFSTKVSEE